MSVVTTSGPAGQSQVASAATNTQQPPVSALTTTIFWIVAAILGTASIALAAYIAAITRYITLYPGDVLWMGTDGTSPDLKAGDTVEVEIAGIGTLRNPFTARLL